MGKAKSSEKPIYELLYIVSNKYGENELAPIVEKVEKIIAKEGGEIKYKEDWGKRRLAYRINLEQHGYYFLAYFQVPGASAQKIDWEIKLAKEVVRHQVLKSSEQAIADRIAFLKNKEDQVAKIMERSSEKEELETTEVKEEKVEEATEAVETKEEAVEKNPEKKEAELEERLENILEGTDLLK